MKKVLFLTSHLASGSSIFFSILAHNARIQGHHLNKPYTHFFSLEELTNNRHKLDNHAAIWMDELLFNYDLNTKVFYEMCKFVYVIREPEPTLNYLVTKGKYKPLGATRYYCYRLRRMCEMAKRTPGAVFLTWEDMVTGRGYPLIEKYLGLKEPLVVMPQAFDGLKTGVNQMIPPEFIQEAERSYEWYLYFLKNQELGHYAATNQ